MRGWLVTLALTALSSCSGHVSLGRTDEDGGPGQGTVNGTADGSRPFGAVSNAWWLQFPKTRVSGGPVISTTVFLFSKPVACDKISVSNWDDSNEPGDTQNLEIVLAWETGTEPTSPPSVDYPAVSVSQGGVPPPASAGVFYQVTPQQPPGTPSEISASAGAVTLTALRDNLDVAGTFDVAFAGGNRVTGSFDAAFCPNGREP